ncbi:hypothetical protein Tco_1275577 [Tanacetum coccineum]
MECLTCHSVCVIRTSWTDYNPGRRFYCCSRRGTNYGIVDWYDPPMCARSVQIIPGLLRNMNGLQARVARNQGESLVTVAFENLTLDAKGVIFDYADAEWVTFDCADGVTLTAGAKGLTVTCDGI